MSSQASNKKSAANSTGGASMQPANKALSHDDINDFWGESLDDAVLGEGENNTAPAGQVSTNVKTRYVTAARIQNPRQNNVIAARLKDEARRSGESFYYGWGNGKDRVMGPSVKLAQAAVRCFGNCAVDVGDVQDTETAWIFTAYFIDLETGYTYARQFRQSKSWVVFGKHDEARKEDMRFQIGQSKAIRNVIINCIPEWMIAGAMKSAQEGVRERVLKFIASKGIVAAQELIVKELARHGVRPEDICNKCGVADIKAVDEEMIVMLRGDMYALDNGMDHADQLFPTISKAIEKHDGTASASNADAAFDDAADEKVESEKKTETTKAQAPTSKA